MGIFVQPFDINFDIDMLIVKGLASYCHCFAKLLHNDTNSDGSDDAEVPIRSAMALMDEGNYGTIRESDRHTTGLGSFFAAWHWQGTAGGKQITLLRFSACVLLA
ncbi:hypothetical protein CEN49_25180 [Fischerella thermalis CCMEE 5273]|nr:hypothetical protein CEN49_25180 [Fischerella thermalis CCMEE 5273]PMB50499.1 hypothetical protein CEN40_01805 [Fischerella thermalis CCMEE 5205]